MTGWNMPPGCNVSDIPGNSPGDQAVEAMYEAIYKILDGEAYDSQVEAIAKLINDAWNDGYQQGVADARYPTDL